MISVADNKEFNLQLTYKGLTEFPDYLLTDNVYKALNLVYLSRNRITKLVNVYILLKDWIAKLKEIKTHTVINSNESGQMLVKVRG